MAIVANVATTIAEIAGLLSSISTIVAIVAIIWKPLSRDCSDRCDENILECSKSLFVPGPLGNFFFYSVAIVAIIWKLVVVRIAQRYCSDRSDRSDHMETSLTIAGKTFSNRGDHVGNHSSAIVVKCCDRYDR